MELVISHLLGRTMDRRPDALIRPTAAKHIAHGRVDIGVTWLWVFLQQGGGAHDLPGLAVAALRDAFFDP
jgi:hypothetical protein